MAFVGLTILVLAIGMAIAPASPGKFRSMGREALPKAGKAFRAARWPARAKLPR
jgi:hypothetical protein